MEIAAAVAFTVIALCAAYLAPAHTGQQFAIAGVLVVIAVALVVAVAGW